MNRTFALLLASALLVAHMLAIHEDVGAAFAPPYEMAHVAFRLGRSLARHGDLGWNPTSPDVEGYPSLAWVALLGIPERLALDTEGFSQLFSALCALVTAWVLARFSPVRLAGVIAPLLFVTSGTVASAAASGTELPLAALLVTGAFLAYEHESRRALAVLLALLCLTRPEGAPLAAGLFAIELARRARVRGTALQPSLLAPFALPAAVALVVMLVRFWLTGHFLSPWAKAFTHPGSLPWRTALDYLRDFFLTSGAGLLIVFPLWYLARGMLTGLGRRALLLTLWWCVLATLGGGGPQALPFSQFMMPILAVLLVAVQEAMTIALDSKRRGFPQLTWVLFLLGMGVSALASKFPGDLGPLRVGRLHRAWMAAHAPHTFGYTNQLGRESLQEEIKNTAFLRGLGAFLRDNLDPGLSVLSPWPGAIGYVSGLQVIDALSRATPTPGALRANPWNAIGPWDLAAVLDQEPDYIVPTLYQGAEAPPAARIVAWWFEGLDLDPRSHERRARILERFGQYELITVPASRTPAAGVRPGGRFYLMRRRALGLAPRLTLERRGDELRVEVRHRAHQQLVDLVVQVESESGEVLSMRPSGELGDAALLRARSTILLHPTGARSIELLRARLPEGARGLRAVLLNPGAVDDDDPVCQPARLELR